MGGSEALRPLLSRTPPGSPSLSRPPLLPRPGSQGRHTEALMGSGTCVLPRDLRPSTVRARKPPTPQPRFGSGSSLPSPATAGHTVTTWALRNASCPGSWEYTDLSKVISATLTTSTFFCAVCGREGGERRAESEAGEDAGSEGSPAGGDPGTTSGPPESGKGLCCWAHAPG